MSYITPLFSAVGVKKLNGSTDANVTQSAADYVKESSPKLLVVQFDDADVAGHNYGYGSEAHLNAITTLDSYIGDIYQAYVDKGIIDDTLFIVTADHGGGGDNDPYQHGSTDVVDMTIPLFIIGDGFAKGEVLNFDISLLDVAPTVVDLLGIEGESYWVGTSLVRSIRKDQVTKKNLSATEANAAALDIFYSRSSWGDYSKHGKIKSFEASAKSLKIGATKNRTAFAGFQLNKSAISEWVRLGYKYISFSVFLSASSGADPMFVDTYVYPYHDEFFVSKPFMTDPNSPSEQYYAHGTKITLDLEALLACTVNGSGLNFILIKDDIWTATGDAYVTFSNVTFSKTL